ncbi:MAG: mucoidy inhibitor MuiA family protein [Methylobacteriaceae bacterium]|nr:mucoidy inhibitor MuiA family protein [Methylobacteriaceae bacterium]
MRRIAAMSSMMTSLKSPLVASATSPATAWAGALAICLALSLPASSAEVEVASKIESVSLSPDAATVTRVAEIDLNPGDVTLIFKNLPFSLDPASLRLTGSAQEKITIGTLEARVSPNDIKSNDSAVEARLRALRADREGWQVSIDALTAKQAMMLRFSQSGPEKLSPESRPLDIAQWNAAWDTVGNALAKVGDELRAAKARARDIDQDMKALENNRERPVARGPGRDVLASLQVPAGVGKPRLELSYRVPGASWLPTYDANVDTTGGKPRLEFVRRATIVQRTGEDWSDAALSVSTVRVSGGTGAPDMQTQRLAFYEPPTPPPEAAAKAAGAAPRAASRALTEAAPAAAAPPHIAAGERVAGLESGAFQATYQVPGRLSVPGDGTPKSFVLSSRQITPTTLIKTVPALDPTAYMEGHFTNDEDAPLLPGDVRVRRDNTFVGTGRVGLVAPGDTLDLGFGADDKVKVTRVPTRRKENEPNWLGQTKIETREFKTTVKNLHDFPVRVTVVDQIPISENSAITVEQLPQTTPPTEKQVGDKRGVMSWTYDLAPAEAKEIRLAYRMKWPAEREVVLERAGK